MEKTSRRGFGKQLGLAIGSLPLISLAETTVGGKEKPFDGDTPIMVGGGGGTRSKKRPKGRPFVEIKFKHDDYVLEGDTYDNNPLVELVSVQVGVPGHWINTYRVAPDARVEIDYKRGGATQTIIINQNGKMGVTFPQSHFDYEVANKRHYHIDLEILELRVGGFPKPLPDMEYFQILAHTKLKTAKNKR